MKEVEDDGPKRCDDEEKNWAPLLLYEKSGGDSVTLDNIDMMWDPYGHFGKALPT